MTRETSHLKRLESFRQDLLAADAADASIMEIAGPDCALIARDLEWVLAASTSTCGTSNASKPNPNPHEAERRIALEAALEPFARFAEALADLGGSTPRTGTFHALESSVSGSAEITVEDFNLALALLTTKTGE